MARTLAFSPLPTVSRLAQERRAGWAELGVATGRKTLAYGQPHRLQPKGSASGVGESPIAPLSAFRADR